MRRHSKTRRSRYSRSVKDHRGWGWDQVVVLSNPRVYDHALSPDEAQRVYEEGILGEAIEAHVQSNLALAEDDPLGDYHTCTALCAADIARRMRS